MALTESLKNWCEQDPNLCRKEDGVESKELG